MGGFCLVIELAWSVYITNKASPLTTDLGKARSCSTNTVVIN